MTIADKLKFLSAFAARPNSIGAVAPSSKHLALRMVEWIDWDAVDAVVEYGPGLGAFTGEVLRCKKPDARFIAIERETAFVVKLRERFPGLAIHQDSAVEVKALCRRENMEQVDAIVSGLPWAAFSEALQSSLLEAMMTVLRPGGQFVTFAYMHGRVLPAGRRFKAFLKRHFAEVNISPVVWRNLPPAIIYRCRR